MFEIAHVTDIDQLRQIALLQESELERLHAKCRQLLQDNARLQGKDGSSAQTELALLQELLAQREQALFGDSSERRFSEKPKRKRETPRRGHGPRPQPELPVEEACHALSEDERGREVCGGTLTEMAGQFEESEEVTVVERHYVLVKHRRQKYRCRCNGNVVTASGPDKLKAGGRYSPGFAVSVAASKYLDHLPLERQSRMMDREGLRIDSQTLWDQLNLLARHLLPSYEALGEQVLSGPLVFADETWWRLMRQKKAKRYWVWGIANHKTAFYRFLDGRGNDSAEKLLGGYSGNVMADGYAVYESLSRDGPGGEGFELHHCWAHVRRKFVTSEAHFPKECQAILDLIGKLFDAERRLPCWNPSAGAEEQAVVLDRIRRLRRKYSRHVIKRIHDWTLEQNPLPKSGLGKAITYMADRWSRLITFLDDPRIPLDNNAAERALRGVVVGRKNHYGSRSKRGTEVAALFYTLFESAKLSGVEPKAYVLKAALAAIRQPGTITLPQDLLETNSK